MCVCVCFVCLLCCFKKNTEFREKEEKGILLSTVENRSKKKNRSNFFGEGEGVSSF